MIKAFLFDYDGVITAGVNDKLPAARLGQKLGVSADVVSDWIRSIWVPYSSGLITEAEAWSHMEQQYGQPIGIQERDIWFTWEELTPLPAMLELVRLLKSKGYPVGLLSNVTPNTAQIIREHGGYDEFDPIILSCDVAARKPDPLIFNIALEKLGGIQPNEVVFLDDREPATVTAENMGMQTILVRDHAEAIAKVMELIGTSDS